MKTIIGTSFGLVLLLALGVIGAMLALGTFSASKAEADVDVTALAASPTRAGSASQISVSFRHQTVLTAGTGQITVKFDSLYGFPAASGTLPKAAVTLTTGQTTGGTSNPAVDPTYTTDAAGDKSVIITIDDTSSATDRQDMFPNRDLAGNATAAGVHTLVFGTAAGITLPTGANTAATNFITLTVGAEGTEAADGLAVPAGIATARTMQLDSITGGAGTVVRITGYGFTTGVSPRVYIDFGDDGDFDAGVDTDLQVASTPAIAGGTFTRDFTVDTTRFTVIGGVGNPISADDGIGNVAGADNVLWVLRGTVTTDKTSATRGETVQVRLRQFGAGAVLAVSFGGVAAPVVAGTTVPASGTLNIDIAVPTTTPLGTQRVSVTGFGEAAARTTTIEVVGAPLTLSTSTAVPGQTITVSGSGFNGTSVIGPITIGGIAVVAANINNNTAVTSDNSGVITIPVKIPNTAVTRAAGTTTLIVNDALLRTGQATLTIPTRAITISPTSSRRGTTVTVTGVGFPAVDAVSFSYGAAATAIGSATTDSVGNFTHTFAVPTDAGISTTNLVTADPTLADVAVATANHSVPGATITAGQASASPGNTVTLTGAGFPGYASMTVLNVGTVGALPTPAPNSDSNGAFSTPFLVPQVALGTLAVTATVGGTTATTSLTIVAAPVVPVAPVVTTTATGTVFADVVANADNLVRVWRYSNATQSWAFYDPRPAFAAANTLTSVSSGDIVWVNVKVQQTFQGQTLFPGWNLISLKIPYP